MPKNLVTTELSISSQHYYITFNHHTGYIAQITLWDERGFTVVEYDTLPAYVQNRMENHILTLCFGFLN